MLLSVSSLAEWTNSMGLFGWLNTGLSQFSIICFDCIIAFKSITFKMDSAENCISKRVSRHQACSGCYVSAIQLHYDVFYEAA